MAKLALNYESEEVLDEAKSFLSKGYSYRPKVLDMFGGGGTIPFEISALGLDSYSMDANEMSVFIQKTNLNLSRKFRGVDVLSIIKNSGDHILDKLEVETEEMYPNRNSNVLGRTTNYIWGYEYKCVKCKSYFSLSKRKWLSKKKGQKLGVVVTEEKSGPKYEINDLDTTNLSTNWIGRTNKISCPHCSSEMDNISVKNAKEVIISEVVKKDRGKKFIVAKSMDDDVLKRIHDIEEKHLVRLGSVLPSSKLPKWSGIVNPALYGIETHSDIFNPRQRAVCVILLSFLKDEYFILSDKYGKDIATYVISILSSLVDQLVDWNCRMSMWISQNEQVGRAFCGPGISMYWDYCETDPASNGPSNLRSKLKRIIAGAAALRIEDRECDVRHGTAQSLPYSDNMFDAVVTDPPYYDNIFYSILADNFYAWKRLLLKHVDNELFSKELTSFDNELVASSKRFGEEAHSKYCRDLTLAINEVSRVLKKDGLLSFVYSHNSILGWAALIESFRNSPMIITSVQPLSIERKSRPRAVTSDAVNTCVTFVARISEKPKEAISSEMLEKRFEEILSSGFSDALTNSGWCDEDISIGLIAHGVALIANSASVLNQDTASALLNIEKMIRRKFEKFKLSKRRPL
ncbi:hypothetical protein [Pseudemcibacter aquimaris]|nr:hypothetical protein [Pseudemcibacter aquimaris]